MQCSIKIWYWSFTLHCCYKLLTFYIFEQQHFNKVWLILNVLLGSQKFYRYVRKKNWRSMHRALKFISVLLEIIRTMLYVRKHQKLLFTDLNSRRANTINMPRNVSMCVNFPSLTCFKSHMFPREYSLWSFIFMLLVYLFDLHHWHTISYLFIALKIILACICSLM
jgi:hypothetical protein